MALVVHLVEAISGIWKVVGAATEAHQVEGTEVAVEKGTTEIRSG